MTTPEAARCDELEGTDWPQGQHPFGHHDPDHWAPWQLYPARWLLYDYADVVTVDLWNVYDPATLDEVVRRVHAVDPLLPAASRAALWIVLSDLYPTFHAPRHP